MAHPDLGLMQEKVGDFIVLNVLFLFLFFWNVIESITDTHNASINLHGYL